MLDSNQNTDRPARRTALIAQELARYDIAIAALSETRLPDEGSLTEDKGGYTFYWKGYPTQERRLHGVGFAIRNSLARSIQDTPTGLSARLMKLRVPLSRDRFATILSCYAPTLDSPEDAKDAFYEQLDAELQRTPISDKLLLLGDFNARVGSSHQAWTGVVGRHGIGKVNTNGQRLLSLCSQNQLVITNTIFKTKDIHKGTWKHPRSGQWHMLDYVIVRQRDRQDVLLTRAMRGAECWTDHYLVRGSLSLRIRPPTRKRPAKKKLNCASLKSEDTKTNLDTVISRHMADAPVLEELDDCVEGGWTHFAQTVTNAAEEVLGFAERNNKDWFDANINDIGELLKAKNKALQAFLNNSNSDYLKRQWQFKRAEAQRILRDMENDWWLNVATDLQGFADCGDLQNFYSSLKQVYGPTNRSLAPVRSQDGTTLLTNRNQILERWQEHYCNLLNTHNPCDPAQLDAIPDMPTVYEMDANPTIEEVKKAICCLKNNKSPGVDGIPGEVLKHGGDALHSRLHEIISAMWEVERVPQQWKDAKIISIYKKKGDRAVCGNSRGISLLSIAGKILAKVLLIRLNKHIVDNVCPETQCGFRKERGTMDMIFTARQLQEKCREQHQNLCLAFIDLTKAFDTVNREMMWRVMKKFGCPDKFTAITRAFHDNMRASVVIGGEETSTFNVELGVKQGCVIAPVLFNIYLAAATTLFREKIPPGHGIGLTYRLDRNLFDLRRLQAGTKTSYDEVFELQYADDCVLVSHSPENLQEALNAIHDIYNTLGLVINTNKTEVMYQWSGVAPQEEPAMNIAGAELKTTTRFNYLGSVLSADCSVDEEVNGRINKAAASFGRIRKRVIQNHNLRIETKVAVYKAVCLSMLLYGSESLTLYRKHIKLLETFHTQCIKNILGITWQDRVPHTDMLERAGIPSVECILLSRQLRWLGHVLRMPATRLPKCTLYGQLARGRRTRGGPKKRFKDQAKKTLKNFDINPDNLEVEAADRDGWRSVCCQGATHFETERTRQRNERRRRRHERGLQPPPTQAPQFQCPECGRRCASRIGLHSHRRTHRP